MWQRHFAVAAMGGGRGNGGDAVATRGEVGGGYWGREER